MRRILISLGLTVLGLVVTWIFLRPREWQTDSVSTKQSIAFVVNLTNDVSRQEEGRLMWSPIRKGDRIFAGDKIKTSGLSATTIQFADTKSKLDIEENSIVVISLDDNKFSLNMLEGRVFVQGNEMKDSVNLLSAGKKINYAGDTAISVSENGESQVESFGSGNIFTDMKPVYSQILLSAKNEVEVSWRGGDKSATVDLFVGESPLLLKKVNSSGVNFAAGKMLSQMKPGVNYWQLAASEQGKEIRSPLMKLVLNRPTPPTQIFPLHKEVVIADDKPFDFKWNKGSSTESTLIEVAKDSEFRQFVIREEVRDQTFYDPVKNLSEGDYFWRISFNLPSGEKVISPVTTFTIHRGGGLPSPVPLLPAERSRFYLSGGSSVEMKFEWKRQENATYLLKVTGPNFSREIDTAMNSGSLTLSQPGEYRWEVTSRDKDGKISVLPSQRTFEVKNEGKISWMMDQKQFSYLDNLPIIILRWQKTYPGSGLLKVAQSPDFKDAETITVPGRDFPFRPVTDGTFFAKIQGMDDSGAVSMSSEIFQFEVKIAPLPPAPLMSNNRKTVITTSTGDFSLSTSNQKTNWLLVAQLVDQKGGILDERMFSDNTVKFSGLLPGKYVMRANYQDEYNRKGEISVVDLVVPEKSRVPAPKIKGIKVR